jgi:hypothetical protein
MSNNASCIIRTEQASKDQSHQFMEWLTSGFDMNIDRQSGENTMGSKVVINFGRRVPDTKGGQTTIKNVYYIDTAEWCCFVNAIHTGRIYDIFADKLSAFRAQTKYKYPNASSEFAVWKFPLKGTSAQDLKRQGRERADQCCESRSLALYPALKAENFCWSFSVGPGRQVDNIISPFNAQELNDYRNWRKAKALPDSGEFMSVFVSQSFNEFEGQILYVDDVRRCYLQRQVTQGAFEWKGRRE